MTSRELQRRLLLAIVGATFGCRERPSAKADTDARDASVTTIATTATTAAPSEPSATAGNAPPSVPIVPPVASTAPKPSGLCGGARTHEICFAPRTNARATGTGEPAPPPPPSAFNAQGCLPKDLVSDTCCIGPAGGPQFRGGQCCYTFCPTGACCGRPFVVRGVARLAPLRRSADWASDFVAIASINEATRIVIARGWLDDARMEHASAAAFGRFVVQLVGLGAPPELVSDAARAAADEVAHAALAFALAARMNGFASGPSPMDLDGALDARTLDAVVAEVIVEGCIGETAAALVASRQLSIATDPETRSALARIAEDEARHAELAWRFVRWAADAGGARTRISAQHVFERALRDASTPTSTAECDRDVDADVFRAHGRLSSRERDETVRSALRDVVTPCGEALFAQYAPMSPVAESLVAPSFVLDASGIPGDPSLHDDAAIKRAGASSTTARAARSASRSSPMRFRRA